MKRKLKNKYERKEMTQRNELSFMLIDETQCQLYIFKHIKTKATKLYQGKRTTFGLPKGVVVLI